jgi:class 3 adenylate cyclase
MSEEIDKRIRGTLWQAIYYEFLRNSFYFPLANILVEMILEGPKEVLESADFYGSIGAAALQAWFLGYRQYKEKPLPLVGNLIGPAIYTLLELVATPGVFLNVPFHVVYWTFSLIIGAFQQLQLSTSGRTSAALLLVESVARSGILVIMFWFIERMQSPAHNNIAYFLADKPHVFIILILPFIAIVTGLDEIRGERFLSLLRETTVQLQQYSRWLLGRDMLSLAIVDPEALSLSRRERAVLFMDIRGFTEWSEPQQPEVVVSMLNRFYDAGEAVLGGSGVIQIKFTADEIMAFFASAEEAVRAALVLHTTTAAILDEYGLNAGTGVHAGPVVEGLFGSSELKRYDIIGDTVNTAKRVCTAAHGGELLISNAVYEGTAAHLCITGKREIVAKGKSVPFVVYSVDLADAAGNSNETDLHHKHHENQN